MEVSISARASFNKCYYLLLEERDLHRSTAVMEKVAGTFHQYPAFTIISHTADQKSADFQNQANSPLVFVNYEKVQG